MIAVLLLLAPQAQLEGGQATPTVEVGRYRHVQALQPGPKGELRFATAGLVARLEWKDGWSWRRVRSGFIEVASLPPESEPVVETRIPLSHNPIREYSWTERPTWRVLEREGWTGLVFVEHGDQPRLRCVGFAQDEREPTTVTGDEIFDARWTASGHELLVGDDGALDRVHVSGGDDEIALGSEALSDADRSSHAIIAATYVVDPKRPTPRQADAWALALKDGKALLLSFPADAGEARPSFALDLDGIEEPWREVVYLAATRGAKCTWVAVGEQAYGTGDGRVTAYRIDAGGTAVKKWSAIGGDPFAPVDWGHDLQFVPDADGDGVADLLICGPWDVLGTSWVDLHSTVTGERLARWDPGFSGGAVGFTASLTHDGATVLVGGTAMQTYPESFAYPGVLTVLSAKTLRPNRAVQESGPGLRSTPHSAR